MAGMQTEVLTYAADVAVTTDVVITPDSFTALENRKVWGVEIASEIDQIEQLALINIWLFMLNAQVSFNGVPNKAGMIAKAKNAVVQSLQGAITPNEVVRMAAVNLYVAFQQSFDWNTGTALNLIIHTVNPSASEVHMDVVATIYYKNA